MSTYFITDSHLGSGADSPERERDLVAFLQSIEDDCEKLFLLGDMFDFWFSYKHVVPRGYVRLLGQLALMADKGIEIHYFIGNHDMWLFDYLEKEIGLIMHTDPEALDLGGKRFFIGHGDGIGKTDRHYLFLKTMFRCRFNQKLFAFFHPWIGFSIALRWSNSSRRSHGRKYEVYLGDEREDIVIFIKKKLQESPFDYFVFGHRHLPLDMELSDSTSGNSTRYINVGNWIDRRTYARFDGMELQLLEYSR